MADLPTSYTPTADENGALVEKVLRGFEQRRLRRYNFEAQWQEAALIFMPEMANTFFYGYDQFPGQKKSQYQIESYPSIALHRFANIACSFITPWTMVWSNIVPGGKDADYLLKQRGVKQYYEQVSSVLWRERYKTGSGFMRSQLMNWLSVGCFGNQNMHVSERKDVWAEPGLSYTSIPVGQMYYETNQQGQVDAYYRAFKWTAKQVYDCWPDNFPPELVPALHQKSSQQFWIIQYVYPRTDWQPEEIGTPRGKRWGCVYISRMGNRILEQGGFRSYPTPSGRYLVFPDEDYGRGPAQIVLGASKTMQAGKVTYLKQTHRAGDPVLLGPDGGLVDSNFRPGDFVEGGVNGEGQRLVDVLPTGKIEYIKDMIENEKAVVDDGFLVSLFQLALKTEEQPQLNVRQVMEMLEQRGMLLGPTLGAQMDEYLGVMVPREIDICSYLGLLPPQPGPVRERGGEFATVFDNPLMRAMSASEATAFMQSVEMATQVAQSSGDPTVWDAFAFNRAIPDMTAARGSPSRWMATAKEIAQKQKGRQQRAERDARAKEMPAQAAIMKAQAITAKAATGGNTGGTLSGTAPGGMPIVPGNPQGMPGQPGIGGRPGMVGRPGR